MRKYSSSISDASQLAQKWFWRYNKDYHEGPVLKNSSELLNNVAVGDRSEFSIRAGCPTRLIIRGKFSKFQGVVIEPQAEKLQKRSTWSFLIHLDPIYPISKIYKIRRLGCFYVRQVSDKYIVLKCFVVQISTENRASLRQDTKWGTASAPTEPENWSGCSNTCASFIAAVWQSYLTVWSHCNLLPRCLLFIAMLYISGL